MILNERMTQSVNEVTTKVFIDSPGFTRSVKHIEEEKTKKEKTEEEEKCI